MNKKPLLSVIVPVYSAFNQLPITLIDIDKHLKTVDFDYEILVVDDDGRDDTINIIRKFEPIIKGLHLVSGEDIKYKEHAVREGVKTAKGKFKLIMNSDNTISIDCFFQMIPYLEGGEDKKYDIIIGSRRVIGSKIIPPQSWRRRALDKINNIIIRAILLPGILDAQSEFCCFSEESANYIFPLTKLNQLSVNIEALALGQKIGYKIKEVPAIWANNTHPPFIISHYIKTLVQIFKIRFWLWTNKYAIHKFVRN